MRGGSRKGKGGHRSKSVRTLRQAPRSAAPGRVIGLLWAAGTAGNLGRCVRRASWSTSKRRSSRAAGSVNRRMGCGRYAPAPALTARAGSTGCLQAMSTRIERRHFVPAPPPPASRPSCPAPSSGRRPRSCRTAGEARRRLVGKRAPVQERRSHDVRRASLRPDHVRRRCARCRRSRASTSSSSTRRTPAWATAGCPTPTGVVQLDACCMHGPRRRAGAVACLEGVRTPSLVAKAVARWNTDHHLLVGQDARRSPADGVHDRGRPEHAEKSRALWLEWKRRIDPRALPRSRGARPPVTRPASTMCGDGLIDPEHYYGTINCNGVDPKGEVCGVTTTSGMAWKIPGRVGDSPDPRRRASTSTAKSARRARPAAARRISTASSSFLIVEKMRRGQSPEGRGHRGAEAHPENTIEKRLLNPRGLPKFGWTSTCSTRGRARGCLLYRAYAVCTENGPQNG